MLEHSIQRKLIVRLRKCGFWACKIDASVMGFPDLFVVSNGRVFLVEVKHPGEAPRPVQLAMHRLLRSHGLDVRVFDGQNIDDFIASLI
jgi:hypothetical protein